MHLPRPAVVAILLVSCSDVVSRSEQRIGAAGGSLTADGLTVEVAAGTVGGDRTFAIVKKKSGSAIPGSFATVGSTFTLEPEGVDFARPVRVTMPFTAESKPGRPGAVVLLRKNKDGRWEHRGARPSGTDRVFGSARRFSEWAPGFWSFDACGLTEKVSADGTRCSLMNEQAGEGVQCRKLANGSHLCACARKTGAPRGLPFAGGCDAQALTVGYRDQCGFGCASDANDGVCAPQTCATRNVGCGLTDDGCGATLNCGTCVAPMQCTAGACSNGGACLPITCAAAGLTCGTATDGCGGQISCGSCPSGQTCVNGACSPAAGGCTPTTCAALSLQCGLVADGCGGTLVCGTCASGACVLGECTASGGCVPSSCTALGFSCGLHPDGCGGLVSCGSCTGGQTCGVDGLCSGTNGCTPSTCASQGAACGLRGDDCGGVLDCGTCPSGQSCSGLTCVPNSSACTPKTCAEVACGLASDGCGGTLLCGSCVPPKTCVANACR